MLGTAERRELVTAAIDRYWKSLAMVDPLRIEAWDDARVTMPLLRVLVYLREHPGAATGDIARNMSVTSSNITRLVDRLVEQGFVRRDEDPADRRYLRHALTAEGEAVLGSVQQKATAFVTHIFDELSDDDLARLTEVFDRLWDAAKRTRRSADAPPREGASTEAVRR